MSVVLPLTCTVHDLKQYKEKKSLWKLNALAKLEIIKRERNDGNILQLLVGRIMQLSNYAKFCNCNLIPFKEKIPPAAT